MNTRDTSRTDPDRPAEAVTSAGSPEEEKEGRFTEKTIRAFTCPPGQPQKVYWHPTTTGFGLRVCKSGARNFVASGRIKGSGIQRQITIGRPSEAMSVKEAHRRACALLQDMHDGKDPKAERAKTKLAIESASITLEGIYEDFKTKTVPGKTTKRRPKTLASYDHTVQHYLAEIKSKPIASLTKEKCEEVFKRISAVSPVAADNAMARLHALCRFARDKYARPDGSFAILGVNPVAAMRKTNPANGQVPRDNRIPKALVRTAYRALKEFEQSTTGAKHTGGNWARFMFLTGTRQGESSEMRHSHIDYGANVLTLPGDITKTGKPFRLPMSEPVRKLLLHRRELHLRAHPEPDTPDDFVFCSSVSKSGHITDCKAALVCVSRIAGKSISKHDFRRTFDDVGMRLKIDGDTRRRLLNHRAPDVHGGHYSNSEEALEEAVALIGQWLESTDDIAVPAPSDAPAALQ